MRKLLLPILAAMTVTSACNNQNQSSNGSTQQSASKQDLYKIYMLNMMGEKLDSGVVKQVTVYQGEYGSDIFKNASKGEAMIRTDGPGSAFIIDTAGNRKAFMDAPIKVEQLNLK